MIVQHVIRERLGRGLHHPLKYADVESCFEGAGADRMFLSVRFIGSPSADDPEHRQKPRSGPPREHREMVRVHYHPSAHRVPMDGDVPWLDVDDPIVVFAEVWPLEREMTQWLPQLRGFLAGLIKANVDGLMQNGLPGQRFLVHASLLPETSEIEVGTTSWTELRRNAEAIHNVNIP